MIVTGKPIREISPSTFIDLTTVPVLHITWDPITYLAVEFDGNLTAAEVLAIQQRIESSNANEETLRNQAITAMQGNRDFLNIVGTPTNAQVLVQVKALSRQSNGVIRMLLGQLDGTD